MLLAMIDGGILRIDYDSESWDGCETCDYGSKYIDQFEIELNMGLIKVETIQMYEYALSEGYMMKLILQNVDIIKQMTENQFYEWIRQKIITDANDEYEVNCYLERNEDNEQTKLEH